MSTEVPDCPECGETDLVSFEELMDHRLESHSVLFSEQLEQAWEKSRDNDKTNGDSQ